MQVFERAPPSLTLEQARAVEASIGVRNSGRQSRLCRALRIDRSAGYFVPDEVVGNRVVINDAIAPGCQQVETFHSREDCGHEICNPDWRKLFVRRTATARRNSMKTSALSAVQHSPAVI
jgi:hypothetical protein